MVAAAADATLAQSRAFAERPNLPTIDFGLTLAVEYLECMNALDRIKTAVATQSRHLDLSGLALTSLPREIGQLTHLESLDLSKNNLQALPESIGQLKQLQSLNLWSNGLHDLPDAFKQLQALQTLQLEDNHFNELPEPILRLPRLHTLNLEHNHLTEIGEDIGQLQQLRHLNVSRNRIVNIHPRIGKLSHLLSLQLGGNLLASLPDEFGQLEQLRQLTLAGNPLSAELLNLAHADARDLRAYFHHRYILHRIAQAKAQDAIKLDLSYEGLEELPAELFELKQLKILSLDGNYLWDIPSDIQRLTQLEVLDLSNNQLVQIPKALQPMSHLKVIETLGNPLPGSGILPKVAPRHDVIAQRIAAAQKSATLDLSDCGLTTVPAEVWQLTHLRTLVLGRVYAEGEALKHRNYIRTLPDAIGQLQQLRTLDVSGNALRDLPAALASLPHLDTVDLAQNAFRRMPLVLTQVDSLQHLDAAHNELMDLPSEAQQWQRLQSLDLSHNQFEALPTALAELPRLHTLDLSHNALAVLDSGIWRKPLYWQVLLLSHNDLRELPNAITQCQLLHTLDVSHNHLAQLNGNILDWRHSLHTLRATHNALNDLPAGARHLYRLEVLDLSHNKLNELPDAILEMRQLQQLTLANNHISDLPPALLQLTHLSHLYLQHNNLPKGIQKALKKGVDGLRDWYLQREALARIQAVKANQSDTLDLADLGLTTLPKALYDLTDLRILILGKAEAHGQHPNQLQDLSKAFTQLQSLEAFHAPHNAFASFPEELLALPALHTIDLSHNGITALPRTLTELKTLTILRLSANPLTELPLELAQLPQLALVAVADIALPESQECVATQPWPEARRTLANALVQDRIARAKDRNWSRLDLSDCLLRELPESLWSLDALKQLDLRHNLLTTLPPEIGQLTQLQTLHLDHNALQDLPRSLAQCTALKTVTYTHNPLQQLPASCLDAPWTFTQLWLTQQALNERLHTLQTSTSTEVMPLYNDAGTIVCQVCAGQPQDTPCVSCHGAGVVPTEQVQLHLILHHAHRYRTKATRHIATLLRQKQSYEKAMLFGAVSESLQSHRVMLQRFERQLLEQETQHHFYTQLAKQIHHLISLEQQLLQQLADVRHIDNVSTGLAFDFEAIAALQHEIQDAVTQLHDFVDAAEAQQVFIPRDCKTVIDGVRLRATAQVEAATDPEDASPEAEVAEELAPEPAEETPWGEVDEPAAEISETADRKEAE